MVLRVYYYDQGLPLHPSISDFGQGPFSLVMTTATEARISVDAGPWAGFQIRLYGSDFRYIQGVPWSGNIESLALYSTEESKVLELTRTDGNGNSFGLFEEIDDFWSTLTTGGALAAQQLLNAQVYTSEYSSFFTDIKGSTGNDSIVHWNIVGDWIESPYNNIYAGSGDDIISGIGGNPKVTIHAGPGNDFVSNINFSYKIEPGYWYGSIILGEGDDTIGEQVFAANVGGDGRDILRPVVSPNGNNIKYWAHSSFGGPDDDIFEVGADLLPETSLTIM